MGKISSFFSAFTRWIGEDDDPNEPVYDPIHLAAVLVGTLAALGLLYWLLWTLLVYDGGLFSKVGPFFHVLLGSMPFLHNHKVGIVPTLSSLRKGTKTLADYGYQGSPYQMGVFRGWVGNLGALIILIGIIISLYRLYQNAAQKHEEKRETH